jgi:hypothetical protein
VKEQYSSERTGLMDECAEAWSDAFNASITGTTMMKGNTPSGGGSFKEFSGFQ